MRPDFIFKVTESGKLIVKNTGEGYTHFRFVVKGPGGTPPSEDSGSGSGSASGDGNEEPTEETELSWQSPICLKSLMQNNLAWQNLTCNQKQVAVELSWNNPQCVSSPLGISLGWHNLICAESILLFDLKWTNKTCVKISEEPTLGLQYGGGTIFYILQPGDIGYDASKVKGFIVSNAASFAYPWSNVEVLIGNLQTGLYDGLLNSIRISTQQNHIVSAAKYCLDLVQNSHGDWYLPSIEELTKLYANKGYLFPQDILGLHWTSNEGSYINGWAINMTNGGSSNTEHKNNSLLVRPIRTFVYPNPVVGDPHEGGIVFYILQPGDYLYEEGKLKGLIAHPTNIGDQYFFSNIIDGYAGTDVPIGLGLSNTDKIINQSGHAFSIAQYCKGLSTGGFGDWYLPSLNELAVLLQNRTYLSGMDDLIYWSSSEYSATHMYGKTLLGSTQFLNKSNVVYCFRPIRTFTIIL